MVKGGNDLHFDPKVIEYRLGRPVLQRLHSHVDSVTFTQI